jgi:hypothetical protein
MNRERPMYSVAAALALAACSNGGGTMPDPRPAADAAPTADTPAEDSPTPVIDAAVPSDAGAVPREFSCDPIVADTILTSPPAAGEPERALALVLRPSGTPCANHLVLQAAGEEHVLSSEPGLIYLAQVHQADDVLVVCLSNERHTPSRAGVAGDRYSEAVALECAARTARGWTATIAAVPGDAAYAAWVVAVTPVAGDPARFVLRWMRDSYFQFLHMVMTGRPPTDGLYETELTLAADTLTAGLAKGLQGPTFETTGTIGEMPAGP